MAGKKRWLSAGVIAIALAFAGSAYAYILPADAILSKVATHRSGLGIKTLTVEGVRKQGELTSPVWHGVRTGKAYRVQTAKNGRTQVDLTIGERRWSFVLGSAAGSPQRVNDDLILQFVLPKGRDPGGKRGLKFLARHKVDDETVSLSRLDSRICYVIGAKPWETNKPQLWIDKELNVPVRLVTIDKQTNVIREQRLIGFGGELVDQWFPRRIEYLENGKVVDSLEFSSIEVNPPLDNDLFAPPK